MKRVTVMACLLAGLGGCAAVRPAGFAVPSVSQVPPPFNEEQTAMALRKGPNTIVGHASFVTPAGSTATCNEASLVPATPYSRWRMQALYGGSGFVDVATAPHVPVDRRYAQYAIKSVCTRSGQFHFTQIANGDYFITASVHWGHGPARHVVSLRTEVNVSGGETRHVTLGN